jgi:hypothetical protein
MKKKQLYTTRPSIIIVSIIMSDFFLPHCMDYWFYIIIVLTLCVAVWVWCVSRKPKESFKASDIIIANTLDYYMDNNAYKKAIKILDDVEVLFCFVQKLQEPANKWRTANYEQGVATDMAKAKFIGKTPSEISAANILTRCYSSTSTGNLISVKFVKYSQLDAFFADQTLHLLNYVDIDRVKLMYFVPFYRFQNIINENAKPTRCLVFDRIAYSYKNSCSLVDLAGNEDADNFFHIFFEFCKGDKMTEKFKDATTKIPATITIDFPVAIRRLVNLEDIFMSIEIDAPNIFSFIVNDVVFLKNQDEAKDNGRYTVVNAIAGVLTLQTYNTVSYHTHFQTTRVKKLGENDQLFTNANDRLIIGIQKTHVILPTGLVWFDDLNMLGNIINNHIAIINTSNRSSENYSCVTDGNLKTKYACDKQKQVWDRQCQQDTDCPFFSFKKRRGGCDVNSGYCEMPIGVDAVGFTRYSQTSRPFCAGCSDKLDPYCCDEKNPSYAYAFEMFDQCDNHVVCESNYEFYNKIKSFSQPHTFDWKGNGFLAVKYVDATHNGQNEADVVANMAVETLIAIANISDYTPAMITVHTIYRYEDLALYLECTVRFSNPKYSHNKLVSFNTKVQNTDVLYYDLKVLGSESSDIAGFSSHNSIPSSSIQTP